MVYTCNILYLLESAIHVRIFMTLCRYMYGSLVFCFGLFCFVCFVLFLFKTDILSFSVSFTKPLEFKSGTSTLFSRTFQRQILFLFFFFETRTTSLKIVAPFLVKGVNHIETLTRRFHAMLNLFSVKNDLKSNMIQSKWLSYTNNTFILWCICTICSVVVPYCCYIVILNNVKYIFDFFSGSPLSLLHFYKLPHRYVATVFLADLKQTFVLNFYILKK